MCLLYSYFTGFFVANQLLLSSSSFSSSNVAHTTHLEGQTHITLKMEKKLKLMLTSDVVVIIRKFFYCTYLHREESRCFIFIFIHLFISYQLCENKQTIYSCTNFCKLMMTINDNQCCYY